MWYRHQGLVLKQICGVHPAEATSGTYSGAFPLDRILGGFWAQLMISYV